MDLLRLAARLYVDSAFRGGIASSVHPQSGPQRSQHILCARPWYSLHQRLVVLKSVNCDSRVGFHDARDTGCKSGLMW